MITKPKKRFCKRCELKKLRLIEAQELDSYDDRMIRVKKKKRILEDSTRESYPIKDVN